MDNPNKLHPSKPMDSFHERFTSIDWDSFAPVDFEEEIVGFDDNVFYLEKQIKRLIHENKVLRSRINKIYG